jgi:hypothetical protein
MKEPSAYMEFHSAFLYPALGIVLEVQPEEDLLQEPSFGLNIPTSNRLAEVLEFY